MVACVIPVHKVVCSSQASLIDFEFLGQHWGQLARDLRCLGMQEYYVGVLDDWTT